MLPYNEKSGQSFCGSFGGKPGQSVKKGKDLYLGPGFCHHAHVTEPQIFAQTKKLANEFRDKVGLSTGRVHHILRGSHRYCICFTKVLVLYHLNHFEWLVTCDIFVPYRMIEYGASDSDIRTKSE